jgi:4-amino-4-deoxy-L-arabinose transferase-like glycosyltransferase
VSEPPEVNVKSFVGGIGCERTMADEGHIRGLMNRSFPRCPICGSNSGYDVTSVIKGHVRCKSCLAEWSSPDFDRSTELARLKLIELPRALPSSAKERQVLRRYEYHPVGFWKTLGGSGRLPHLSFTFRDMKTVLPKLVFLLFLASLPRLLLIDKTSIMTDEPLYVSAGRIYVQSFLTLNFSTDVWSQNAEHPPIAKLWIGLSSDLFIPLLGGEDTHNLYFAARIAPVTAGTLLCVAIYVFGRKQYGENPSLLASLLAAMSPWLVYYSTLAILDIFAALFVTLTFIFLSYAETSNRYYVLVGVLLGLAVGSKEIVATVIPGIALYLLITKLVFDGTQSKKNFHVPWQALKQILLTPLIAAFVFFATWPWLWEDTLARIWWVIMFHVGHITAGHTTFFAGQVFIHVPAWVPIYVVFVKTPLLIFVPSVFFMLYVPIKIIRKKPVQRGHIGVFSWLVGGLLTMSTFNMIIGDHYLLFLGPAVLLSASLFVFDLLEMTRKLNAKINKAHLVLYALVVLMVTESLGGLVTNIPSPCGYANELIGSADKSVLMIDTGFEEAADYLIGNVEKNATVAVAYDVDLLRTELLRKYESGFNLVSLDELDDAKYAVFPSIYTQRYGVPAEVTNSWSLVYVARSGQSVLAYVYKAPP